jgi:hypothetical protein
VDENGHGKTQLRCIVLNMVKYATP